MPGVHPDSPHRQGSLDRGDARVGTCYGHRSAAEYNKALVKATEQSEGKVHLMHYARKLLNDDYVAEFVVVNGPIDPGMKVYSRIPGTTSPIFIAGDPAQGNVVPLKSLPLWTLEYGKNILPDWLSDGEDVVEEWTRLEEDGKYVFYAPSSYKGGPIIWFHSKHLISEALVYESNRSYMIPNKSSKQDVGLTEVASSQEFS
jgi:hypothetical protein